MAVVYLLHFEPSYRHAKHYVGYANNLDARIAHHRNGTGANLTKYASAAGCQLIVARTWNNATRATERKIKTSRHHSRLCPLCNPHAARRGNLKTETENAQKF
jgi:predicted GIY-YIG superfamily endonuclease